MEKGRKTKEENENKLKIEKKKQEKSCHEAIKQSLHKERDRENFSNTCETLE